MPRQKTTPVHHGHTSSRSHPFLGHGLIANSFIEQRHQTVLSKGMILKSDYFPDGFKKNLQQWRIRGAPNFRQTPRAPIYGVAQPSIDGMRCVLNMIKTYKSKQREIIWINLREEPVIFINSRPYVLREFSNPFRNMSDFEGIDAHRLEEIEFRLKDDILREADEHDNNILVHDEEDGGIVPYFCSCSKYTVFTPAEVVSMLTTEGYSLVSIRIPVTAESFFSYESVDQVIHTYIKCIRDAGPKKNSAGMLFNCQMGRGRSTFGMVLVYLIRLALNEHFKIPTSSSNTGGHTMIGPSQLLRSVSDNSRSTPLKMRKPSIPKKELSVEHHQLYIEKKDQQDGLSRYRRGEYDLVLRLLRILKDGKDNKKIVDFVIDQIGRVHNLREHILSVHLKAIQLSKDVEDDEEVFENTKSALLRYFQLILFQGYLSSCKRKVLLSLVSDHDNSAYSDNYAKFLLTNSFADWMAEHSEYNKLADVFISDPSISKQFKFPHQESAEDVSKTDKVVIERKGNVLGREMILFNEHPETIDDEADEKEFYRHLEILPVAITSQPDLQAARNILSGLHQARMPNLFKKNSHQKASEEEVPCKTILWLNVREEPVLYVKGRPCLVRHMRRPLTVLKEFTHTGVSAERTEEVELSFKKDVIDEINRNNGSILCHSMTIDNQLTAKYVNISPEEVLTCKEVYELLSTEGYNVLYHRVPLQVENYLSVAAFDSLFKIFRHEQCPGLTTIISCQGGGRRSSVGMVIACLTYMHLGLFGVTLESKDVTTQIEQLNVGLEEELDEETPNVDVVITDIKDSESSEEDNNIESNHSRTMKTQKGEFKGIMSLIRLLNKGSLMKGRVDAIIGICGSVYNILDNIILHRDKAENERLKAARHALETSSIRHLVSYAYLIVFNAFLYERKRFILKSRMKQLDEDNINCDMDSLFPAEKHHEIMGADQKNEISFQEWLNNRPELVRELSMLVSEPKKALQLVIDEPSLTENMQIVAPERNGHVLIRTSILKSDYFKGCQNRKIKQILQGAINFRCLDDSNLRVAGTGIPSACGIANILSYISTGCRPVRPREITEDQVWDEKDEQFESKDKAIKQQELKLVNDDDMLEVICSILPASSILWLDMREEPYLYIDGTPYCLRNYEQPYSNLEHTGITQRRLQAMERQLKRDVLIECEKFDNQFLVHDEDENGGLCGEWKNIEAENVQTSEELFTSIMNDKIDMKMSEYHRTPITDERAPTPEAIDGLISLLENGANWQNRYIIFHCQMGRGRTTTGMVIAGLWSMHRLKTVVDHEGVTNTTWSPDLEGHATIDDVPILSKEKATELQQGRWKVVNSLVRLLPDGEVVKQEVDKVIDVAAGMQNLRVAVYDLQMMALRSLPRKKPTFVHRGKLYLQRYFYLIVINAYLRGLTSDEHKQSFKEWLEERSEINNLLPIDNIDNLVFPELN